LNFDAIDKIERDVAAHRAFEAWLPRLGLMSIILGGICGAMVGVKVPFGLFAVNSSNWPSFAVTVIPFTIGLVILWQKRFSPAVRWVGALFWVSSLSYWKLILATYSLHSFAPDLSTEHAVNHDVSCFALGFAASAVPMVCGLALHQRLGLAPSYRVRLVTGAIAAGCGLLAQGIFCPYVNLAHVSIAHLGQSLCIFSIVFAMDTKMATAWSGKNNSRLS